MTGDEVFQQFMISVRPFTCLLECPFPVLHFDDVLLSINLSVSLCVACGEMIGR